MTCRGVGIRVATVAVALAVLSACSGGDDDATPGPTGGTTTTTEKRGPAPDYSKVVLREVAGTPTTVAELRGGEVILQGSVTGPEGRVPGAVVEITRLVGGGATERFLTDETGAWQVPELLGGRYRIRAFLAPDLAMSEPVIAFVEAAQTRTFDLRVDKLSGIAVTSSVNPDPAPVGARQTLQVFVFRRTVDGDGIVRSSRLRDTKVELLETNVWRVETENPALTGNQGQRKWVVTCERAGDHRLQLVVADRRVVTLQLGPCGLPPTTTTASTTPPA